MEVVGKDDAMDRKSLAGFLGLNTNADRLTTTYWRFQQGWVKKLIFIRRGRTHVSSMTYLLDGKSGQF